MVVTDISVRWHQPAGMRRRWSVRSMEDILRSINDQSENKICFEQINGSDGTDRKPMKNTEGLFEWVNREGFIYRNWLIGQPNNMNGNEDYIELRPDGCGMTRMGHPAEFVCMKFHVGPLTK